MPLRSIAAVIFFSAIVSCFGNFDPKPNGEADPCQAVDCGDHGECASEDERSWCDCAPGFHPEGLYCYADTGQPDGDADSDTDTDTDADTDTETDADQQLCAEVDQECASDIPCCDQENAACASFDGEPPLCYQTCDLMSCLYGAEVGACIEVNEEGEVGLCIPTAVAMNPVSCDPEIGTCTTEYGVTEGAVCAPGGNGQNYCLEMCALAPNDCVDSQLCVHGFNGIGVCFRY